MFVRKLALPTRLLVKTLESLATHRDIAIVRERDSDFLVIKTPGIEVWVDKSLNMLRFQWYERGTLWSYHEKDVDVGKIYEKIRDEVFKTIRDPSYQPDIAGVAELVESALKK
jgi:hypothetical protein